MTQDLTLRQVVEEIIKDKSGLFFNELADELVLEWLDDILDELEEENKILRTKKDRIVWIWNPSPKVKKLIEEGVEV